MRTTLEPIQGRISNGWEWNSFRNDCHKYSREKLTQELADCKKVLREVIDRLQWLKKERRNLQAAAGQSSCLSNSKAITAEYIRLRRDIEERMAGIKQIRRSLAEPKVLQEEMHSLHQAIRHATFEQCELLRELSLSRTSINKAEEQPGFFISTSATKEENFGLQTKIEEEQQRKKKLLRRIAEELHRHCELSKVRSLLRRKK